MASTVGQTVPFSIRNMHPYDWDTAVRLTQAEGWPHRREDWEFHSRLGHGLVACNKEGTLIGTAISWAYGEKAGALGLIVVDGRFRGMGVGRRLMQAVLEEAEGRTLQLVTSRGGVVLCERLGFRKAGQVQQWQGLPQSEVQYQLSGVTVREAKEDDFTSICQMDHAAYGAPRAELLRAIFDSSGGVIAERDGEVVGFGLARNGGRGVVIGPVAATDQKVAKCVVSRLLSRTTKFTRIDVPANLSELAGFLHEAGLTLVDQSSVMVKGEPLVKDEALSVFAMASQSLG